MLGTTQSSNSTDVTVIGGGLIGCSIALRLAQAKLKVCVVDRGEPGAETSSAAAGMIAPQGETVAPDAFFDLGAASRDLYPEFVKEIESLSGQSVGYRRDGCFVVATNQDEGRELEAIYNGQTAYGLPLEKLSGDEVRRSMSEASPEVRCGLFVKGDDWLDNERLAQALVEACRRVGVTFCSHAAVRKMNVDFRPSAGSQRPLSAENGQAFRANNKGTGRVVSAEARGESGGGSVALSAGQFVLAAGSWSGELMAPLGISLPVKPCRGQIIEFESPTELRHVIRAGLHYLVPRANRRVLAGTTAEYVGFQKEVTGEGLRSIVEGVSRLVRAVKEFRFRRAWAGLRPDTPDHHPILGYGPCENLIFATGHYRHGILLAPITAKLITELITTGRTSTSIKAYRPGRFANL